MVLWDKTSPASAHMPCGTSIYIWRAQSIAPSTLAVHSQIRERTLDLTSAPWLHTGGWLIRHQAETTTSNSARTECTWRALPAQSLAWKTAIPIGRQIFNMTALCQA